MPDTTVQVSRVSKRFRLGETHDSLRDLAASAIHRLRGRRGKRSNRRTFWALHDVGFAVGRGEAFGIIGPNGAGKSTILKLLAGILRPDRGSIDVRGRLAALIEVGAGFHGDLTGRENVFLNGAILGMTRAEVRRKLDDIVAFAGIERFLDMPVKRYSSGMHARLGFSIAAHVDPDVLLVDEVLSVGDAVFRLRCIERMRALVDRGTTLVFVTHNLEQMRSICRRALVLEQGRGVFEGFSKDAIGRYLDAVSRAQAERPVDIPGRTGTDGAVELLRFALWNDKGEEVASASPREPIRAAVTFRLNRRIPQLVIELNLRTAVLENLLSLNSGRDGLIYDAPAGVSTLTLTLPRIPLSGGQYFWNVRIWDAEAGENLLDTPPRFPMVIEDDGRSTGMVTVDREWMLERASPQSSVPAAAAMETPQRPAQPPVTRSNVNENLLLR